MHLGDTQRRTWGLTQNSGYSVCKKCLSPQEQCFLHISLKTACECAPLTPYQKSSFNHCQRNKECYLDQGNVCKKTVSQQKPLFITRRRQLQIKLTVEGSQQHERKVNETNLEEKMNKECWKSKTNMKLTSSK